MRNLLDSIVSALAVYATAFRSKLSLFLKYRWGHHIHIHRNMFSISPSHVYGPTKWSLFFSSIIGGHIHIREMSQISSHTRPWRFRFLIVRVYMAPRNVLFFSQVSLGIRVIFTYIKCLEFQVRYDRDDSKFSESWYTWPHKLSKVFVLFLHCLGIFTWQFPLEMLLHPRNPPNRETEFSRHHMVQIQIKILVSFASRFVPWNLSFWIWWMSGVHRFRIGTVKHDTSSVSSQRNNSRVRRRVPGGEHP